MKPTTNSSGLYARIAVCPGRECPVRRLSEDGRVRDFRPGRSDGHPPQIAVEPPNGGGGDPLADYPVEEIAWVGGHAVCRLPTVGPVSAFETADAIVADQGVDGRLPPPCENYGGGGCLAYGFSFLPVEPYRFHWRGGWLQLHFAVSEYSALQRTIERLNDAGFDLDLRQIIRSERARELQADAESTTAVVDLLTLTERQREVAETAIEMGYFEPDGADAETIAAKLDVSRSTLSRHLRIVIRKILSQLFP
ncbi:helix-turn-helix domain-containing protein [Halegenticoccus soli]|uniref:helix-turn-helix domain-containing protein n=1 Tax=Halegenticoccus soli TaxID=1985678 RepID=UPI000C6E6741|nr:helix-turn-helix domain-containing protein [Halegenticoccus soli]